MTMSASTQYTVVILFYPRMMHVVYWSTNIQSINDSCSACQGWQTVWTVLAENYFTNDEGASFWQHLLSANKQIGTCGMERHALDKPGKKILLYEVTLNAHVLQYLL